MGDRVTTGDRCEGGLAGVEQFIRDHEAWLGPCATWFVRSLWAQAALQVFEDSRRVIEQADRYTPQRLEDACRRALVYNLRSLADLGVIFAEGLDRLPLRPDADLSGQLSLPFPQDRP